jgi:hypothetical protein
MADLPKATARIDETGAGVGVGADYALILSCMEKGPIATIRRTTKVQDTLDEFGHGEGLDVAGHYVELTGLPYLFARLTSASAAAIGPIDTTGVTGTSVVTFTGAPLDEEDLVVKVELGGTIGTGPIEIRTSRDGGRTYSGKVRLGNTNIYVIPDTGITANFAAGNLVTGDIAKAHCYPAKWDSTGLAAGFTALQAFSTRPRIVVLCGDIINGTELQAVIDQIEAYETTVERESVVICSLRSRYPDAVMQGKPIDVDFDGTAHTITRATGSWVTDGFQVGMHVTPSGTTLNNSDLGALTTVTATVLTFASGVTTEANVDFSTGGKSITATEPKATWRAALEAIVGATPQTQKQSTKIVACGGRARRTSPITKSYKRRPSSIAIATREMAHDVHISPAQVDLGPLKGWDLFDDKGTLYEHDERVDGGLLAARIACLRTFNEKSGTYVALPLTLDVDNKPLSRLQITLVAQLACTIARAAYEDKLNSPVLLLTDGSGFIQEGEARRIDQYVQTQLQIALLTPGPEGQRASAAVPRMDRNIDMRVQGQIVPWQLDLTMLGYLEQLAGRVRVNG